MRGSLVKIERGLNERSGAREDFVGRLGPDDGSAPALRGDELGNCRLQRADAPIRAAW